MSIVDDALRALGTSEHPDKVPADQAEARRLAARTVAHELYAGKRAGARSKPWPMLAAVALLILGLVTWWWMDRTAAWMPGTVVVPATQKISQTPAAAQVASAAAPVVAVAVSEPAPVPQPPLPATDAVPTMATATPNAPVVAEAPAKPAATAVSKPASVTKPSTAQTMASKRAVVPVAEITTAASAHATFPALVASSPAVGARVDMVLSVDDRAHRALDTLSRGDLKEAMQLAEQLIAVQPGRWEGHYVMGSALLASGSVREAEAVLGQALVLQPSSASVLLQAGMAAQETGQSIKALGLLRRASAVAPDNAAVWLNLGYSADLAGVREEAQAAYQRYLKLTNARTGTDSQRAYVSERLQFLGKH